MSRQEAIQVIKQTASAFKRNLGPSCRGMVVYGSALQSHFNPQSSDINLMLVVADGFDLNTARSVFVPIWGELGHHLGRAPLVLTQTGYQRYLTLFPALRYHIATYGKPVFGDALETLNLTRPNKREALAYIADELLKCSMLATPDLLDGPDRQELKRTLGRLSRKLKKETGELTDIESVAALLGHITPKADPLPVDPSQPYPVKGLVSVYDKLGQIFFVLNSAADIPKTDWAEIGKMAQDAGYPKIAITTHPIFKLLIETVYPADFALLSYNHTSGEDLLTELTAIPSVVLRNSSQVAAQYEVDFFPNAVLTSKIEEPVDSKLIHDFQNKLLNIRLQNELLSRLKLTEKVTPDPLPDRHQPSSVRLQAIWERFSLWAGFYLKASYAAEA